MSYARKGRADDQDRKTHHHRLDYTPEGVLLKPAPVFAPTRPEDVFASLLYRGTPKTLEEMDAGVLAEAKRRHARD